MRRLDALTIEKEGITSDELMERAVKQLALEIKNRWPQDTPFVIFAGSGNNGGDALGLARVLASDGYAVDTFLFDTSHGLSPDCERNRQRLQAVVDEVGERAKLNVVSQQFVPPVLTKETVVVDGLFGTGLTRGLSGGYAAVVQYLNASPATVVSIDVPSGLMTEDNASMNPAAVIHADYTFTFQCPKLAFLLPENERFVGRWSVLDIGLAEPTEELEADTFQTPYEMTEESDVCALVKPRSLFAHKGQMGHGALVAGQRGMAGAAVLAARAAMRSGIGKLTALTQEANRTILQVAVPEALCEVQGHPDYFAADVNLEPYDALAVGPGIGQNADTADALDDLLFDLRIPLVLDADALNLMAQRREWMGRLPENTVLTPHRGELERLVGHEPNSYELLQKTIETARTSKSVIVMKGAFTAVVTPGGTVHFNPTGNPGMATAGSGDVLTGVILALLAGGYKATDAARLAVYVHGLAGDIAADRLGQTSLMASDIIDALPEAFETLA